mmetsp:Transcript_74393/g.177258  ORF Transcript_74393/g.177258 Transcript_74393/m.177258 type:complete len:265 (+) Transcript_74393:2178-2972(+)
MSSGSCTQAPSRVRCIRLVPSMISRLCKRFASAIFTSRTGAAAKIRSCTSRNPVNSLMETSASLLSGAAPPSVLAPASETRWESDATAAALRTSPSPMEAGIVAPIMRNSRRPLMVSVSAYPMKVVEAWSSSESFLRRPYGLTTLGLDSLLPRNPKASVTASRRSLKVASLGTVISKTPPGVSLSSQTAWRIFTVTSSAGGRTSACFCFAVDASGFEPSVPGSFSVAAILLGCSFARSRRLVDPLSRTTLAALGFRRGAGKFPM